MKNDLLSIGEMAKLKGVGVKALRYYEKIGLLLPAYVDEFSGYRYYNLNQSAEIDIIITCLDIGIPLKEVAQHRNDDGSMDMKSLLELGKQRAETKLEHLKRRTRQIESYIKGVEERDVLERKIAGTPFLVTPLQSMDLDIKEYIKKITLLYEEAEEAGLNSLYLDGIIFDPEKSRLLCVIEVDDLSEELTKAHETFVYPDGKFIRKVIKNNSLKACFQNVMGEIEDKKESTLPIGAFSVWQQHHKLKVTAVDLIYGA